MAEKLLKIKKMITKAIGLVFNNATSVGKLMSAGVQVASRIIVPLFSG
ncbi:MAG: hypothetical protein GX796_09150 [Clostridiaceae bacterium]|nr:hypothetical protein [Clostridiaceae bacterium]